MATYAGWRLHGIAGGLIAGLLFIMPGAVIIMALAAIYERGQVPLFGFLLRGKGSGCGDCYAGIAAYRQKSAVTSRIGL